MGATTTFVVAGDGAVDAGAAAIGFGSAFAGGGTEMAEFTDALACDPLIFAVGAGKELDGGSTRGALTSAKGGTATGTPLTPIA